MLGPPLGGFITTYLSWHWIFFIDLPLGAVVFVLALLWIENIRSGERRGFDWLTFLLAAVASTGIVYAIEKLGSEGITWQRPAAILTVSLVSGVLAILAARRRPTISFIGIESLKIKTYSNSIYGASIFRISVSVLPFVLPLMFRRPLASAHSTPDSTYWRFSGAT